MKPIVLSSLLLLIPVLVLGRPAAAPSFEVASVKLHTFPPGAFGFGPGPGGEEANIHISGNRVTIGQSSLTRLVMAAYNVKDFQIAGVSATLLGLDQLYDITAKVEGEDTPALEQVRLMLRSLLAERFQLRLHRETKELPVYNLVVGKNGPKLKASTGPRPPQPVAYNGPVIQFNLLDRSVADLVRFVAPTWIGQCSIRPVSLDVTISLWNTTAAIRTGPRTKPRRRSSRPFRISG